MHVHRASLWKQHPHKTNLKSFHIRRPHMIGLPQRCHLETPPRRPVSGILLRVACDPSVSALSLETNLMSSAPVPCLGPAPARLPMSDARKADHNRRGCRDETIPAPGNHVHNDLAVLSSISPQISTQLPSDEALSTNPLAVQAQQVIGSQQLRLLSSHVSRSYPACSLWDCSQPKSCHL